MKNLDKLLKILEIPTYYGMEHLIKDYIKENYPTTEDIYGNLYLQKGTSKSYVCVTAHLDGCLNSNLDLIKRNMNKTIKVEDNIIKAYHPLTGQRMGISADDLSGVFACLEIFDSVDNVKVALFVEEEYGCRGSQNCNLDFFNDVNYLIGFDSIEDKQFSAKLQNRDVYSKEFYESIETILNNYNFTEPTYHTYTDILIISQRVGISSINIPTGNYNIHSELEYLDTNITTKAINCALDMINNIKNKKYEIEKDIGYSI